MLKVPRWWILIIAIFVLIAAYNLSYFTSKQEAVPGKYSVGTCLKNEEFDSVSRIEARTSAGYSLRILKSGKYPEDPNHALGAEQHLPLGQVDSSSKERPIPCPDDQP